MGLRKVYARAEHRAVGRGASAAAACRCSRAAVARVMGDAAYSFSLTTFSPNGKLIEIEYALQAVAAGATSLGIRASNGVVIATEKKVPTILVDESTVQRLRWSRRTRASCTAA